MRVSEEWVDNYLKKRETHGNAPVVTKSQPTQSELTEEPLYRSKWEAQYAYMLELRKKLAADHPDKIVDWKHEPFKLKLYTKVTTKKGKATRRSIYYIPDFMILHVDGSMEMVEVKGYERKAGELKYFQAVKEYPGFTWRKVGKENSNWVDIHYKDGVSKPRT
jgi:hypothetical protein